LGVATEAKSSSNNFVLLGFVLGVVLFGVADADFGVFGVFGVLGVFTGVLRFATRVAVFELGEGRPDPLPVGVCGANWALSGVGVSGSVIEAGEGEFAALTRTVS
jgi:hypothetical protein